MIDLRSDTVTQPTDEMRRAMFEAEVGDDVYQEDPTINELEKEAARRLGKEAALFVTSGTQGNQMAILTHARPGDEVLLEADSHLFLYEAGAMAALASVQTRTISGQRGQMPIDQLEQAIRGNDIHFPQTALICLENTHNRAGGTVLPVSYMRDVYSVAKQHQIPVHLDGARLWNAAVALGVDVKEFTQYTDTVQVCLSKGLSAPVGSILAGPKDWIEEARKWRKRLGGGMRQAGVIAAPAMVALTEMVDRLAEDHDRAKQLERGMRGIDAFQHHVEEAETNIVLVHTEHLQLSAGTLVTHLKEKHQLLVNSFGPYTIRLMTHRHITDEDITATLKAFQQSVTELNMVGTEGIGSAE